MAAALLIVGAHSWPLVDLRIDWQAEPEKALRALWRQYDYLIVNEWQRITSPHAPRALEPVRGPDDFDNRAAFVAAGAGRMLSRHRHRERRSRPPRHRMSPTAWPD